MVIMYVYTTAELMFKGVLNIGGVRGCTRVLLVLLPFGTTFPYKMGVSAHANFGESRISLTKIHNEEHKAVVNLFIDSDEILQKGVCACLRACECVQVCMCNCVL